MSGHCGHFGHSQQPGQKQLYLPYGITPLGDSLKTLVGLFGLRPAELEMMRVLDGKLKVGNVKCNRATAKTPKPDRIAYPPELKELAGAVGQALSQL